jgi:hypothetical protein
MSYEGANMEASKNLEFAKMPHKGTPIRYGLKHVRNRQQGAGRILPRRIWADMQARNFSRNTAVGMKWGKQASRAADARKYGFLEVSI